MRFPRLSSFRRTNRNRAGTGANPTWQDNMPTWDGRAGPGRYLHIPEIDRWRAIPYDMPPPPERGTVLQRVRQLTESLNGAIDEGTGAALDRLIESWTGAWIAGVETDYTDHCGVIQVHRGQALEWLTESTRTAEHERGEHDRLRDDYLDCRERLSGRAGGPAAPTPGDDAAAPGWADPHLVAGRSIAGLALGALLVLAGALTDTVAFKNILTLVLRKESETVAWLMAAGATSVALVAAGSLGVALAIHRRGPRRTPRFTLIGSAAVWLGLGLAMFLVRWLDSSATGAPSISGLPAQGQSSGWVALFFGAIYLISGTCTMFEAERLYNPEYFAFIRLRKQYRTQAARIAGADATVDRARTAVELHDGELDREDHRRTAAIAERKALGAEAANYARILMAGMLKDPAKTGLTETGPVPQMPPPPPGAGPEAGDGPGQEDVTDAA